MVRLSKIYTRGGDKGKTSLSTGERVAKYDLRVEAYGTVDEANATLGLAGLEAEGASELASILMRVQNDLFDLGADLATPIIPDLPYEPLRMTEAQVTWLETKIDALNDRLAPLESFILPGGSRLASYLHLARTVTRRAERLTAQLDDQFDITPAALKYLNRLSDLLFVMSRVANENGAGDVLWIPGKNR